MNGLPIPPDRCAMKCIDLQSITNDALLIYDFLRTWLDSSLLPGYFCTMNGLRASVGLKMHDFPRACQTPAQQQLASSGGGRFVFLSHSASLLLEDAGRRRDGGNGDFARVKIRTEVQTARHRRRRRLWLLAVDTQTPSTAHGHARVRKIVAFPLHTSGLSCVSLQCQCSG